MKSRLWITTYRIALITALALGGATVRTSLADEQFSRILNGTPVASGEWSAVVSLQYADEPSDYGHFCGGVAISPTYVLTAAHCVSGYTRSPRLLRVIGGRTLLSSQDGQVAEIRSIFIHPEFSEYQLRHDVALLRLKTRLAVDTLQILRPDERELLIPPATALILGWGVTDAAFPIRPDNLQMAEIPLVDRRQCAERLGLDFSPQTMLCGGVLASSPDSPDGVDTCTGDSGSPLLIPATTGWKIAGISSWGYECGSSRFWGVYTDIAAYADWISSHTSHRPVAVRSPRIRGQARIGRSLYCSKGRWEGSRSLRFQYRWLDETLQPIQAKESPRHRVTNRERGKRLVCEVTAIDSDAKGTAYSRATGPVQ